MASCRSSTAWARSSPRSNASSANNIRFRRRPHRVLPHDVGVSGDEYFVDVDETDDPVLLVASVVCLDLINETWTS
jgi:hypothetical protein